MNIELRPIDEIKPYEQNPRKNEAAVELVARSIKEFGFRQPIVVDKDGVIVCGHTRWKAARKMGLAKVPVHVAAELTDAQAKAYRLADNRTNQIAEWDLDLLPRELAEVKALDVDLDVLGWSDSELSELLAPPATVGETDPDDVPAPPAEATTKPGDLWILGEHKLLCGDSSKAADVDRLLDGAPVHLVNTDPPYNVKVEPRSNNAIAAGLSSFTSSKSRTSACSSQNGQVEGVDTGGTPVPQGKEGHSAKGSRHHQKFDVERHPGKAKGTHKQLRAKDRPLANDFVSDDEFDRLLDAWFGNISRVLVPGGGFYIWGGYANCGNYPPVLKRHQLYFSQAIIWDKQHPVLTRKDFMGAHEWCFYGWREGAAHRFFGPNNATDLWPVKKINPQSMIHLTEKPVELARRAIEYSSRAGEHVLDLFGGSGSTLVACEMTGRRAHLMELDPPYCDVIVQRWEQFTGRKAERVASSMPSIKDVAEEKAPENRAEKTQETEVDDGLSGTS